MQLPVKHYFSEMNALFEFCNNHQTNSVQRSIKSGVVDPQEISHKNKSLVYIYSLAVNKRHSEARISIFSENEDQSILFVKIYQQRLA